MNSNIPSDRDSGGTQKITHSPLPRWLEDITGNVSTIPTSECDKNKIKIDSTLINLSGINHRNDIEMPDIETSLKPEQNSSSAKYGRRASITAQIAATSSANSNVVMKSDYLVPKMDDKFNYSVMDDQEGLEKSWKSLSLFQQSHKGRLDSAKNANPPPRISLGYETLSPLSSVCSTSNSDHSSTYSPSLLENVPTRCKSEMSAKLDEYTYITKSESHLKSHITPTTNSLQVSKSKSSEHVPGNSAIEKRDFRYDILNESLRNILNGEDTKRNRQVDTTKNCDNPLLSLERHLNEYKLNVAKEDILRKEIIKELLSENEKISKKIKETNASVNSRKILRTPSFEDVSTHRKLYNKNSKYKSTYSKSKEKSKNNSDTQIGTNKDVSVIDDLGDFIIPELPTGTVLVFNILSTWGDKHYVGLNGIEIFRSDGKIASVKKITASPLDVNVLPECKNDPRVVTNVLDGVNRTQDDVHLWLTPFEKGQNHTVAIEFREPTTVAMIRIWNYNKSRIHSYRGVKDMFITLDGRIIFKGEIAKACGGILGGVDAFGDTILFTLDDQILELISQNDDSYLTLTSTSQPDTPLKEDRPLTSSLLPDDEDRPYTGALNQVSSPPTTRAHYTTYDDQILFGGNSLHIILVSNWGNRNMIGLTGLEIVDERDNVLELDQMDVRCNINCEIFDLHRVINGQNLTVNPNDMWCVPYEYGQDTVISVRFPTFLYVTGLRIWNYNESLDTTYAGVSRMRLLLDDKIILNPLTKDEIFLIRRAPGNLHYDYVQEIIFIPEPCDTHSVCLSPTFNITHSHKEEFYEYPTMPEGFVLQFIVFSTWGDQYYCGLNGLELYDHVGKKVILDQSNICAYPESINVLSNVEGDVRTPDKLIDGINDDTNGAHAWLAPIIPKNLNRIYVVLDQPVTISVIKIWNYSKTPARGVKEFGILVDDLLVYNGILDKYSCKHGGNSYRTVLFTDDANVLEQELETLIRNSGYGQEVLLLNENMRSTTGGSLPDADPALRPFTSVSPLIRGQSSYSN